VQRMVTLFPFLSDYLRVWEMDLFKDAYAELKAYFRSYDPRHQKKDEIFTKLGYIDIQHLAKRIKGTVLMGVGLMDTVCPPSTHFAVYNKIEATKRIEIYPDFGHEGLWGFNDIAMQFMLEI
jgi:cephalosporin-C deacetylase